MKHNTPIKEKSLSPDLTGQSAITAVTTGGTFEELDDRILKTLLAAGDKKAIDIVVLDLRGIASFTDYFVITSGTNERQVQAISDEIVEKLKKAGARVARVEGRQTAEWILLDYGDFVVHVFEDKARRFYDLERLWRDSRRVELPADLADRTDSSLRKES
jgi:ribosome-associated protein